MHSLSVVVRDNSPPDHNRWRISEIDLLIGKKLRLLRTQRGIHPQLLDHAIGAPVGTVSRYEAGARPIAAVYLYQLSRLLETPLSEFFRETGEEPPECSEVSPTCAPPAMHEPPTPAEVQRFLSMYDQLDDPDIRQTVRDLLRTLAEKGDQ